MLMMNIDAAADDDAEHWIVKEEKWGKDCCWNGIHIIEFNIKEQPMVFPKLQNRSTLCRLDSGHWTVQRRKKNSQSFQSRVWAQWNPPEPVFVMMMMMMMMINGGTIIQRGVGLLCRQRQWGIRNPLCPVLGTRLNLAPNNNQLPAILRHGRTP